jgi:indole-3-glycerol phosphate synthase
MMGFERVLPVTEQRPKYLRRGPEVQASIGWSPPSGALGTLVNEARERAAHLRSRASELRDALHSAPVVPSFDAALRGRATVQVIAEIKRASPSRGVIADGLDAGVQAQAYSDGGAAAISVLTEPVRFMGHIRDLEAARAGGLPLLRKDFIVDRLQLWEARVCGASAALLIARALAPDNLAELFGEAREIGLDVLVEIHTDAELEFARAAEFPIVGVNNRNLETLDVDRGVGSRLIPQIPAGAIAIYESGVVTAADVEGAAEAGADAVLVGSALSASADPGAAVRGLTGVARRGRRAS